MIHNHRNDFEINLMCDQLEVSRAGYYDWIERPPSPATLQRDTIVDAIRQCHVESHCRYGSPNLHRDLLKRASVAASIPSPGG